MRSGTGEITDWVYDSFDDSMYTSGLPQMKYHRYKGWNVVFDRFARELQSFILSFRFFEYAPYFSCLLYTSDAADE